MKQRSIAATDGTRVEVVRKQRRRINISILIRDPKNKRDHVIIIPIFFGRSRDRILVGIPTIRTEIVHSLFQPLQANSDEGMRTRKKSRTKFEIQFDIFSSEKTHYFVELYLQIEKKKKNRHDIKYSLNSVL
jgi:hypothetical protein